MAVLLYSHYSHLTVPGRAHLGLGLMGVPEGLVERSILNAGLPA